LGVILAILAIGAPFGCTREFFREWANQDVSEAIFEKSRDPRWRIDLFSVEPPMLSRFADPYDQDVPPAPPDDPAAEALSPVPQWPDNRLMVPLEGTGYLDLMEYWRRDAEAKAAAAGRPLPPFEPEFWERPDNARHFVTDPRQPGEPGQPLAPPGPPETTSPFTAPPGVPPLGGPGGTGTGAPGSRVPRGLRGGVPRAGGGMPGAPGSLAPEGATPSLPGRNPAGATPSLPGGNPAGATPSLPRTPQTRNQQSPARRDDIPPPQVVRLQSADDTGTTRIKPPRRFDGNQSRGTNSGANRQSLTPIPLSGAKAPASKTKIPPPRSAASFSRLPSSQAKGATDRSLARTSYQTGEAPGQPEKGWRKDSRTEILQMVLTPQNQPTPATASRAGAQPAAAPQPAAAAQPAWDLQLLPGVKEVSGLPTTGKKLVIVAAVNQVLQFRMFDADGKQFIDTDETGLPAKAPAIDDLRKQLEGLWPPHTLTTNEKDQVVAAVRKIVGDEIGGPQQPTAPGQPQPVTTNPINEQLTPSEGGPQPPPLPRPIQPVAPASPGVILDREVAAERLPVSPAQISEAGRMTQTEAAELSTVLVPYVNLQTDQEGYGFPKGARVYKVNMQQAWLLALMNARFYQFNLETLYLTALPVTLQRFAFEPQFYASLGQVTGVPQNGNGAGGSFPPTPGVAASSGVSFNYATRFAPGGQVSVLNLGTVAGFGKLFNSGGQLLMGFANEVAFNFVNKNPAQPTVISALPISFVQPLLRGGGRAVILEPLTQAERNLLYAVRTFALFRQQFFVVTLTGGTIQNFGQGFNLVGFSAPGNTDPTIGFIPVVFNLVEIEVDRRNLVFLESLAKLYQELIQGEASGLSRLQVDQVMQRVLAGRQALEADKITYRTQLDEFKMQLSLPPDTPMVVDMSLAEPFYRVFNAVDNWQRDSRRSLEQLPGIIAQIPELEDVDIEGRSALKPYRNYRSTLKEFLPDNEEILEDLLQSAVRISLEYRMDLMNNRAQLYDAWRQIRFSANALKGILNLTLSNNVYAPNGGPNPFAFLSQAKQFSLALNAELPLVRVSERNAFRTALISYQRLRRGLQTAEDNLKVQLRNDLRSVHIAYITYEIAKRNFELNVRLKDQAFEAIIAPPQGGAQALAQQANSAVQTTNLLNFQQQLILAMLALTNGWQAYQTARLILYRDIGILPYDEWEAFSELYPAQYHGPIIGHAPAGGAGFTPPPEARTATPEPR
jgi:hypothetical protein